MFAILAVYREYTSNKEVNDIRKGGETFYFKCTCCLNVVLSALKSFDVSKRKCKL